MSDTVEIRLAFKRKDQAEAARGLVERVATGMDGDQGTSSIAAADDGLSLVLDASGCPSAYDLEDPHGLFMQLCFACAYDDGRAEYEATATRPHEGGLALGRAFYDGYVMGFKYLDADPSADGDVDWSCDCWHLWTLMHGGFVDLDEWRVGSDF